MKKLLLLGAMQMHIPIIKRAKEKGIYVITCDYIPENEGHKYADECFFDSTTDINAVYNIAKRCNVEGIMTFNSDPAAISAAYIAEQLRLPGSGYNAVKIMSEKDLFRKFLSENGFNVPYFSQYTEVEALLNFKELKQYIEYLSEEINNCSVSVYTITNGLLLTKEMLLFFKKYNVNVGFSIDGISTIHNKWRCNTFDKTIDKINLFKEVFGYYPSMNCTVGTDVINHADETIEFFKKFNNRITFSRMIGKYGIERKEFDGFIEYASKELNVRTGGYDCTMYGGKCAAGINNYFYANGKVYLCGNCIDLKYSLPSITPLDEINFDINSFDRNKCFKEESNPCE